MTFSSAIVISIFFCCSILLQRPVPLSAYIVEQNDYVSWNLDRISHESLSSEDADDYSYLYPATNTENVSVYVLDSGINGGHREFGGRVTFLTSLVRDDKSPTDRTGHGTAIASVIGGHFTGIAKYVQIYSIKIANQDGYTNSRFVPLILEFVDRFLNRIMLNGLTFAERHGHDKTKRIIVIGTVITASDAIERAVRRMVLDDYLIISAAGDLGLDDCKVSPPSEPYSIAVAASDIEDEYTKFSNNGKCIKNIAPGVNVAVAHHSNNRGFRRSSGTHIAAAHVAGVAALILAKSDNYNAIGLHARLQQISQSNVIENVPKYTLNQMINIVQLQKDEEELETVGSLIKS